jgi:hypothetical protein
MAFLVLLLILEALQLFLDVFNHIIVVFNITFSSSHVAINVSFFSFELSSLIWNILQLIILLSLLLFKTNNFLFKGVDLFLRKFILGLTWHQSTFWLTSTGHSSTCLDDFTLDSHYSVSFVSPKWNFSSCIKIFTHESISQSMVKSISSLIVLNLYKIKKSFWVFWAFEFLFAISLDLS